MSPPRKWWVLTAVASGTFMATLDSSIVNLALPTLVREMGSNLLQVKWVVVAYLLIVTCFLLPFGRISDRFGRKRIFTWGLGVFTMGSFLCGLAPTLSLLIVARVFQAFGVCMLMANGPAIITATFGPSERGSALGVLAMVVSGGLLSGPSVGGFLIGQFGWRSIFWANIPVGLLGLFLVRVFVKESKSAALVKLPFDWAGTLCQGLVLFAFIILFDPPNISLSGSLAVPMPRTILLGVVILLLALFLKIESDAKAPVVDLELLKNRAFWTGNLAGLFLFVAYSGITVLTPFYLEEVLLKSPEQAGLILTAIPLAIFVVAPISGKLSDTLGGRGLSLLGTLIGSVTLFALGGAFGSGVTDTTADHWIIVGMALIGVATGLFQSPNNNAIMSSVPSDKLGVASAFLATTRNLGMVTGTGLVTALFALRIRENPTDTIGAIRMGMLISGMVGALAAMVCLAKPRRNAWVGEKKKNH